MIYDLTESKVKPNFYYYKKETLLGELIITYKNKKHLFNSLDQICEFYPELVKLKPMIIDYLLSYNECVISDLRIEFFNK